MIPQDQNKEPIKIRQESKTPPPDRPVERPKDLEKEKDKRDKFKRALQKPEGGGEEVEEVEEPSDLTSPLSLAAQGSAKKVVARGTSPEVLQQVQNAIFESGIDEETKKKLKAKLPKILDIIENETKKRLQEELAMQGVVQQVSQSQITQETAVEKAESTQEARRLAIQLAEQMLESLQEITKSDRTEIEMTLRYPPLFEGVTIQITEFNTAKKQFNLTFFNLTNPDARRLVEMQANQAALRNALIERGYTLQLVTIEPKAEIIRPMAAEEPQGGKKEQGSKRGKEGRPSYDEGGPLTG
jgi:hypothetical protein